MTNAKERHLFVIAGSNGAGKTTFAREFLPNFAHCLRFINPDLIAAGLSPFDPAAAARAAGRLVLREAQRAIRSRGSFAFETTLAGRTYLHLLRQAQAAGYSIHLIYLWIPSPELALARIRDRVESGGHQVPEADVRRRYRRSVRNLFLLYGPVANSLHVFDNSGASPRLVFRAEDGKTVVLDKPLYTVIEEQGST